ncbi:protein of unknown function [Actinopolyspora mzabensis]|uniref:DUF4265 domain-containing protein n=1 Tax=Actinopolyspora mzabensis TaxID=995066 RepID=A0A1G8XQR0_ACTMZ|nr:DUF4265 domain-containing protein [Actinopolyspora mzabensis]SDJ92803.1 protein of unknown function [Actinopolyspora mzabensis]
MNSTDSKLPLNNELDLAHHVKIVVPLEQDEDGYPPIAAESLWAVPVREGEGYSVENIPFFAPRLSLKDLVKTATDDEGNLVFDRVISGGGHSTMRVIFFDDTGMSDFKSCIRNFGCDYEVGHKDTFLAIDIHPEVSYADVIDYMIQKFREGVLDFEEASIQHD